MDLLEYAALKQKGLIHLAGATATINRGEITVIDKTQVEAAIKQRKEEIEQLTELLLDLP